MKMAITCENNEFLVIILKHVSGLTNHAHPPATSKLGAIAHKNGHKTKKPSVFGHALKHVSGIMVVINRPGTPKLWGITHKNVHKMQKRCVFGDKSQTCKSP